MPSPSPELLFPATAGEAASLFGDGAGVTVFAGGTILMPALTHGELRLGKTLMLARAGLDGLSGEGGSLRIGAAVTVAALTDAPARALQGVVYPPSTLIAVPVTNEALSESSQTHAAAISSGLANRPIG